MAPPLSKSSIPLVAGFAGLVLTAGGCGTRGTLDSGGTSGGDGFSGAWNLVSQGYASYAARPMPQLVTDPDDAGFCYGYFGGMDLRTDGTADLIFGYAEVQGGGCAALVGANIESDRAPATWAERDNGDLLFYRETGSYGSGEGQADYGESGYMSQDGGATSSGSTSAGIPEQEIWLVCRPSELELDCVSANAMGEPEPSAFNLTFRRPACEGPSDCSQGEYCFGGQCVVATIYDGGYEDSGGYSETGGYMDGGTDDGSMDGTLPPELALPPR